MTTIPATTDPLTNDLITSSMQLVVIEQFKNDLATWIAQEHDKQHRDVFISLHKQYTAHSEYLSEYVRLTSEALARRELLHHEETP